MAKTRSQTGKIIIKKEEEEEEEEDRKPTIGLRSSTRTTSGKITKRKPFEGNNRRVPAQQVKVEEDTDTKSLLQSSPKLVKRHYVSQEQINQLIDAIVDDNMSINKASRMAKMTFLTASYYYNVYRNDPEKKIPSPRKQLVHPKKRYTQEQTENLIRYIKNDKMTIKEASAKANLAYESGKYYYKKYLDDPEHNIPNPQLGRHVTEDQKNAFIGYIINNKMSIAAASKKAKMNVHAGKRHYHKYFNDQTPGTTAPSHIIKIKHYTHEQINEVISCIVNDKMTIAAASRKVNMCPTAARRHYHEYLANHNMALPAPRCYTQDEIDEFIGYIVNDKMDVMPASKKANMPYDTGRKFFQQYAREHNLVMSDIKYPPGKVKKFIGYIVRDKMSIHAASKRLNIQPRVGTKLYQRYLKDNNMEIPVPKSSKRYTQEEINQLIGYIVNDKMGIKAASEKAKIQYETGKKYYHRYLKQHNLDIPMFKYGQDSINQLIGYIINDKMTITAASKKANMHYSAGQRYYHQYLKEHNLDMPTRRIITQDQIDELIGYLVDDKMSLTAASKKANMSHTTALKYYRKYLKDQQA